MSLLTPVKVPVKVYRWDDVGAPVLDKTPGCMMTIFKACLVTGYGTKEAAGWTMPFEDTAAGVKGFRPQVGAEIDFCLRCSLDTGTKLTAQIYQNMIDANTGTLVMQPSAVFSYAVAKASGKWLLIATPLGFWFSCETRYKATASKTGAFFYCGYISASDDGIKAVYLQHSGGSYADADHASMLGVRTSETTVDRNLTEYSSAKVLRGDQVFTVDPLSLFNGAKVMSTAPHQCPVLTSVNGNLHLLPGVFAPANGALNNNFDNLTLSDNGINAVSFGTSGNIDSAICIATDNWVY